MGDNRLWSECLYFFLKWVMIVFVFCCLFLLCFNYNLNWCVMILCRFGNFGSVDGLC